MDEKLDDMLRSLVAERAAHQFMLDFLLMQLFARFPRDQRLELAGGLLDASVQTEFLFGQTKGDDFASEGLADMVVRMQESIDQAVGRALHKVAEVEDERLAQLGARG